MNCPYCNFRFKLLMANSPDIPRIAPAVCSDCGEVGLIINGQIRKATELEMDALKESPAWREVIGPARDIIAANKRAKSARNN